MQGAGMRAKDTQLLVVSILGVPGIWFDNLWHWVVANSLYIRPILRYVCCHSFAARSLSAGSLWFPPPLAGQHIRVLLQTQVG
jgi:hypothetical protein